MGSCFTYLVRLLLHCLIHVCRMYSVSVQEQFFGSKVGLPAEAPKRKTSFPISRAEVTAEWLTNAVVPQELRENGVKISNFTIGDVGEIHGYAGSSAIINDIQYEGPLVCLSLSLSLSLSIVDGGSNVISSIFWVWHRMESTSCHTCCTSSSLCLHRMPFALFSREPRCTSVRSCLIATYCLVLQELAMYVQCWQSSSGE